MDNDAMDRLPEGMRVLAVDNNPICLKTMELTLRQCHYQVTTANHASEAMKILRANRNMFDLVISDLKMPDMDGFHLLQLLGNEMVDLPVVLVSTDGDTELIKKGISYGACCCLKKPVAVEVLKTIWQHVFRRKKLMNPRDQYYCKSPYQFGEDEQEVISSTCSSEQNLKGKRKRKEQQTRYDEDEDEDMKLPRKNHRMDWTPELHDKFVDAYNFLERTRKSSPKEILELMNVEGLTRRHVASHLQKFRVHLREGKVSYRRCRDLDPWRKHVHSSSGLSYTPPRMLCNSTNSSAAPFSYSRMAQPSQNLCNSLNYVANPQPSVVTHESSMIGVNGQSMSNNGASTTNFPFMRLPESSICYDNCGTLTSRGNPQVVGNQACLNSLYRESSFDNGICTSQVVDYNGHGVVHIHNPQGQNMDQSDVVCNTSLNSSPFEQPSGSNTTIVLENCNMHTKNDPDKDFILLEQSKLDYTVTVPDNVFESQNDQERDELKDYDILIDLGFDVDALREQVQ